jgi:hypothetical protein
LQILTYRSCQKEEEKQKKLDVDPDFDKDGSRFRSDGVHSVSKMRALGLKEDLKIRMLSSW